MALARSRGQDFAEPLDIGLEWEAGAPCPCVIADEQRAVIVFRCVDRQKSQHVHVPRVSGVRYDRGPETWGIVEFIGAVEIRFGGPNEEGLHLLDLHDRGLRKFEAHIIHNSQWLAERTQLEAGYRARTRRTGQSFSTTTSRFTTRWWKP